MRECDYCHLAQSRRTHETKDMGKQRLRPSLFPGCAPYLNFLPPDEEYEDGPEHLEELLLPFAAPLGASAPVIECFVRYGFKYVEVRLQCWFSIFDLA